MITNVDFTYCLISQGSQYLCYAVPIGHVNSSFGHEKVMEKSWKIIFEKEWSPWYRPQHWRWLKARRKTANSQPPPLMK